MQKKWISLLLLSTLVSCQSLQRSKTESTKEPLGTSNTQEQIDEPAPVTSRQEKKLGVILGPGYLKSFAHLGVLKELEQNNIPIASIAGIEWGAIVAAGYAMHGRVTEPEWQMFKLKEDMLPDSGIFSKKISPKNVQDLQGFLDSLFKNVRVEESKVPFTCPTISLKSFSPQFIENGLFKNELPRCFSGTSFYKSHHAWAWDPLSLNKIITKMKKSGITHILLVDVLSPNDYNISQSWLGNESDIYIWGKADREFYEHSNKVDFYIPVTMGQKINSFDDIRNFTREGQNAMNFKVRKVSQEILGR